MIGDWRKVETHSELGYFRPYTTRIVDKVCV